MNHGRTIFAQLVELLPRKAFDLAVRRYDGQHRVRALSCMDQLLCMIFAQLTARASLRDQMVPLAGAYYVLDRGYVDFARLYRMHLAGAFFVTRAKRGLDARVRERRPVPPEGPVRSDWLIRLGGPLSRGLYPDTLRRIRYVDPVTGKRLVFLTNNLTLDALTIALLYRKRWRIELFFKWIKQHLHITAFFGTTPNAVQSQLWIAVIVYVLVAQCKQRQQLPQTLNDVLQILGVMLLQKTPINAVFLRKDVSEMIGVNRNQLELFDL